MRSNHGLFHRIDKSIGAETVNVAESDSLETALLEAAAAELLKGGTLVCWGIPARIVAAWAGCHPTTNVISWYLDLYHARRLPDEFQKPENLSVHCQSDWPAQSNDVSVLYLPQHGEAELARDLLQSAWQNLIDRGTLLVGVDSSADEWLAAQLAIYGTVQVVCRSGDFTVYRIQKLQALKKPRVFRSQQSLRICGRTLWVVSRPGVFAHRKIDGGARQLIQAAQSDQAQRIMDLGCGSGTVSLALGFLRPEASLLAVDSNARALKCLSEAIEINQLNNIQTKLNCDGILTKVGEFQLVLANPPYFSRFKIASQFLETAVRILCDGGRLILVTKTPRWYSENLPEDLQQFSTEPSKGYTLIRAVRRFR